MFCIIKKNGIHNKKGIIEDIAISIRDEVEIEKDVTIEDLFNFLITMEDQIDTVFAPWTRGFKIRPFFDEMQKDKENMNMISINLNWCPEIFEWENDDCEIESEFSEYVNVFGASIKSDKYSLDFSPISDIKDCVIILDESWILTKSYTDIILESNKKFTLEDVIGSILHEITFHGYPENRQEQLNSLKESVDRIDDNREETISSEEFRLGYLEDKLERLVENEKFEKAEKVKKEIEDIRKKLL